MRLPISRASSHGAWRHAFLTHRRSFLLYSTQTVRGFSNRRSVPSANAAHALTCGSRRDQCRPRQRVHSSREDLFYPSVIRIHVPPLRDRREEIRT